MKSNLLMFVLLIFCLSNTAAQELKVLKGTVIDQDSLPIAGINIINLSRGSGTSSLDNGQFKITAEVDDSIYFSSVQYENETIKVTALMLAINNKVQLNDRLNELDEVLIKDIDLTGHLANDEKNRELSVYEEYGIPFPKKPEPVISRQLNFMRGGFSDPVSAIAYTINGKRKVMEKAQELSETQDLVTKAYGLIPLKYYTEDLNIPQDEIENFLYYLVEFSVFKEMLRVKNIFGLMDFMKDHSEEFLEIRKREKNE